MVAAVPLPILGRVDERGAARGRRLAWSTAIFSAATGLSRILGLVREIVARRYFGVEGAGINSFTVAFQIPNLVRALVADAALSSAFVPVFSELLEKGERQRAWRVASTLFWLTLLILSGVTAVFILLAPLLMKPFGDPGGDYDLAVSLSRVLFPIVTLLGISGIVVGILNSYDHFTVPALSPVFWNIAIIGGLAIGVLLNLVVTYDTHIHLDLDRMRIPIAFVMILIVLLVRPDGLFTRGGSAVERV